MITQQGLDDLRKLVAEDEFTLLSSTQLLRLLDNHTRLAGRVDHLTRQR